MGVELRGDPGQCVKPRPCPKLWLGCGGARAGTLPLLLSFARRQEMMKENPVWKGETLVLPVLLQPLRCAWF